MFDLLDLAFRIPEYWYEVLRKGDRDLASDAPRAPGNDGHLAGERLGE